METIYLTHETAWWYWSNAKSAATTLAIAKRRQVMKDCALSVPAIRALARSGVFAGQHLSVATPVRGRRNGEGVTFHYCSTQLPRGSYVQLSQTVYVASPELSFLQAAAAQPFWEAVLYGFLLCGSFALDASSKWGTAPRAPLTSKKKLAAFLDQCSGQPGVKAARKALRYVLEGSASPRESKTALLLTLPLCKGGYGIPAMELNAELLVPEHLRGLAARQTFRVDFLWRNYGIAGEYDSDAAHLESEERCNDATKRLALKAMSLEPFEFTKLQVDNVHRMDETVALLRKKMGLRFPQRLPKDYARRQRQLRSDLGFGA